MTYMSSEYSLSLTHDISARFRTCRLNLDGRRCRRRLATDIGDGTNKLDADRRKRHAVR